MYDRKKTLMLLLGSLLAWPAAAQHVPQAVRHNIHTCGSASCAGASGSGSQPRDTLFLNPPPYTRWHIQRGFGVVAIRHEEDDVGRHSFLEHAMGGSPQEAEQNVRKKCGRDKCHIIARTSNACVAVSHAIDIDRNNRYTERFYVAPLDAEARRMLAEGLGDTGARKNVGFHHHIRDAADAACTADPRNRSTGYRGLCYDTEVFCALDSISPGY